MQIYKFLFFVGILESKIDFTSDDALKLTYGFPTGYWHQEYYPSTHWTEIGEILFIDNFKQTYLYQRLQSNNRTKFLFDSLNTKTFDSSVFGTSSAERKDNKLLGKIQETRITGLDAVLETKSIVNLDQICIAGAVSLINSLISQEYAISTDETHFESLQLLVISSYDLVMMYKLTKDAPETAAVLSMKISQDQVQSTFSLMCKDNVSRLKRKIIIKNSKWTFGLAGCDMPLVLDNGFNIFSLLIKLALEPELIDLYNNLNKQFGDIDWFDFYRQVIIFILKFIQDTRTTDDSKDNNEYVLYIFLSFFFFCFFLFFFFFNIFGACKT